MRLKPRPKSLSQRLWGAATQSAVLCAMVTVVLLPVGYTQAADFSGDIGEPALPGSPSALMAENDCWSGAAPADMEGVIPGHVVVGRDDKTYYGGERLVSQALKQVFEHEPHGLTIYGFCR